MRDPRSVVRAACAQIAASQHGVIAKHQALEAGLSLDSIYRFTAAGLWKPIHPGVYILWTPPRSDDRWRQRMAAGSLWLGTGSGASHRAASRIWEIVPNAPLEFSTVTAKRHPDLIIHRVRRLSLEDLVVQDGIVVTSPARTIVDLGTVVRPDVLEVAFERALRNKITTRTHIARALERAGPTHAGRAALRELLGQLMRITESDLEMLFWQLLRRRGLPLPTRQFEVRDRSGRSIGRPDFAYVDARIAIETDGFEFHSSRRDLRRDHQKQNTLVWAGWLVYRLMWEDVVYDPDRVGDDIAALLASRSSRSDQG